MITLPIVGTPLIIGTFYFFPAQLTSRPYFFTINSGGCAYKPIPTLPVDIYVMVA